MPAKRTPRTRKPSTPRQLVPQPHGGALLPGAGGGPQPGSGRPPAAFTNFLAKLREDPQVRSALERAMKDEKGRNFASALKVLTDYDTTKPAEKKDWSGKLEVTVRVAREGRRVTAG